MYCTVFFHLFCLFCRLLFFLSVLSYLYFHYILLEGAFLPLRQYPKPSSSFSFYLQLLLIIVSFISTCYYTENILLLHLRRHRNIYTNMFVTVSSLYTNNFCNALLHHLTKLYEVFQRNEKELIQTFPLNQFFLLSL